MFDFEWCNDPSTMDRCYIVDMTCSRLYCCSNSLLFSLSFQALSFISFVCFAASTAAGFVTVPLLEFLAAVFLVFAYSTKFNERFKGFLWPLMVRKTVYFILRITRRSVALFPCRWHVRLKQGPTVHSMVVISWLWTQSGSTTVCTCGFSQVETVPGYGLEGNLSRSIVHRRVRMNATERRERGEDLNKNARSETFDW